jgi:integrase/recombinase XerC
VILELLYGCGLRVAELCGLNLDDFRDEDVILVRGKGKKERLVILGEYAQAAIQAWLPARAKWLGKLKLQTNALLFSVGNRHDVEHHPPRAESGHRGQGSAAVSSPPAAPRLRHPHCTITAHRSRP